MCYLDRYRIRTGCGTRNVVLSARVKGYLLDQDRNRLRTECDKKCCPIRIRIGIGSGQNVKRNVLSGLGLELDRGRMGNKICWAICARKMTLAGSEYDM